MAYSNVPLGLYTWLLRMAVSKSKILIPHIAHYKCCQALTCKRVIQIHYVLVVAKVLTEIVCKL